MVCTQKRHKFEWPACDHCELSASTDHLGFWEKRRGEFGKGATFRGDRCILPAGVLKIARRPTVAATSVGHTNVQGGEVIRTRGTLVPSWEGCSCPKCCEGNVDWNQHFVEWIMLCYGRMLINAFCIITTLSIITPFIWLLHSDSLLNCHLDYLSCVTNQCFTNSRLVVATNQTHKSKHRAPLHAGNAHPPRSFQPFFEPRYMTQVEGFLRCLLP